METPSLQSAVVNEAKLFFYNFFFKEFLFLTPVYRAKLICFC